MCKNFRHATSPKIQVFFSGETGGAGYPAPPRINQVAMFSR
jgi:hypothetical protein